MIIQLLHKIYKIYLKHQIQFFLMLLIGAHRPPADPDFYKTKALPGDGVFSLLRRYNLDRNSCNVSKFYALNDLKNGSQLKVGQDYTLPIFIYNFDGKTIRSSIGIKDWQTAKTIENYNEVMFADGYRQTSFRKDKVLWVPYHLLNCPNTDVKKASLNDSASNGEDFWGCSRRSPSRPQASRQSAKYPF